MFLKILESIEKNDTIVIFGHINPDGDCYGSQIGLRNSLRLAYPHKKIYASGSGLPLFYDYIGEMDQVPFETIKHCLAIIVDGNDLSRMEDDRCIYAIDFAKIDHHIDTGTFSQGPYVVDTKSNSTCELITKFIIECHLPIDKSVANPLYLGMLTDTGRFQFVNDFSEAFHLSAYLCEHGADPKKINSILNAVDEKSLKVKGYFYTHFKKSDGGTLYIIFNQEELKELGVDSNYISNLINLLGNVKGYPCWATFVETSEHRLRCEFRSNGPAVQPIALKYGGGGHLLASGATLKEFSMETVFNIIKDIDEAIANFKGE